LKPSRRTAGGHRRYTVADVAALQRLRHLIATGMPTASAAALALALESEHAPGPSRSAVRHQPAHWFATAVEALDPREAAAAATRIVDRFGVVPAWTEVFVPHLQAAGEHWECTGEGVEREHLAAAAIQSALSRHTLRRRERPFRLKMLAVATPNEGHTLPLDALAAALADSDVSSYVLGTLPAPALHAAVQDVAPSVLVLWARTRETSDVRLLRSVLDRVPLVCAAGPGWQPRRLPRTVTHLADLPTAVASVLAWTT
jgi:DNA-binding transcriptional MerR regulator